MTNPPTGRTVRLRDARASTDGGRRLTIIETRNRECGIADVFIGP